LAVLVMKKMQKIKIWNIDTFSCWGTCPAVTLGILIYTRKTKPLPCIKAGKSIVKRGKYRKPPTISPPPEYKLPVYKPTTCTNAHFIPNISAPPNINPPEYKATCLSLLITIITMINTCLSLLLYLLIYHYYTNTKDRPCISSPVYMPTLV
jgi:hypothetical protein